MLPRHANEFILQLLEPFVSVVHGRQRTFENPAVMDVFRMCDPVSNFHRGLECSPSSVSKSHPQRLPETGSGGFVNFLDLVENLKVLHLLFYGSVLPEYFFDLLEFLAGLFL